MPRVYWRLKYDRSVTAKLYQLREAGYALYNDIKALVIQEKPWEDAMPVQSRDGWYEFESHGYFVGFTVSTNPEDKEPTLIVLYIDQL